MTAVSVKDLEAAISSQQELVERQGDVVRSLKAEVKEGKVLKHDVDAAIEKLKELKIALDGKLKEFQVRWRLWRAGRGCGGGRRGAGRSRGRIRGEGKSRRCLPGGVSAGRCLCRAVSLPGGVSTGRYLYRAMSLPALEPSGRLGARLAC